jgi:hypothetical protein
LDKKIPSPTLGHFFETRRFSRRAKKIFESAVGNVCRDGQAKPGEWVIFRSVASNEHSKSRRSDKKGGQIGKITQMTQSEDFTGYLTFRQYIFNKSFMIFQIIHTIYCVF